ncbi:MAG TPA: energy transducer TonB [Chryseosolibacter sp.]|nr:energy transducer TonB [Chryseosolibacter sp.]
MKSRPEVTDNEIQQFMDFDKLLLDRNRLIREQRRARITRNTLLSLTGLAILVILAIRLRSDTPHETLKSATPAQNPTDSVAEITRSLKPDAEEQFQIPDEKVVSGENQPGVRNDRSGHRAKLPATGKNDPAVATEETRTTPVYTQAEPKDGYPALYEYFRRELKYPAEAIKDSIQGIVTVIFTIDITGKPTDVQIENSLGAAFDRQVLIVINEMPPWKPASYNERPVPSKISLPLTFELKKVEPKN